MTTLAEGKQSEITDSEAKSRLHVMRCNTISASGHLPLADGHLSLLGQYKSTHHFSSSELQSPRNSEQEF
jgi:hypothetical protein